MKTITFDRWEQGVDLRKGPSVTDANRLREMDNCFVSSGWGIQKRPGFRKVFDLPAGTKGLKGFSGKLHTFSRVEISTTNAIHANNVIPHPDTTEDIKEVHFVDVFNNALYVACEYDDDSIRHHYISGSAPFVVADTNCPNTKSLVKIASKLWAQDDDVVRYTAVNAPTDWTTSEDAGFLPTGLQAEGDNNVLAVGEYNNRLSVFHEDSIQVWIVDPDPVLNVLESNIQNIGSKYPNSTQTVGGNLYFLSPEGFRSVSQQAYTNNYIDLDIGTQIDSIVTPQIGNGVVRSIYYPGSGQYWCAIGEKIFVFTFSRTSKINAWSVYRLPFVVDEMTSLGSQLYIRSGDSVYIADEAFYTDDGASIPVNILTGYNNFKKPGLLKQMIGIDAVAEGSVNISIATDAADISLETPKIVLSGDTRSGPLNPVEVMATEAAFRFTNDADEFFRLDSFSVGYNDLNSQ